MDESRFSYHRAVAPMMWILVAIATVELVVVHWLLSLWSPVAALLLSFVSLGTLAWLVATIAGFRRLPVIVGADRVVMRVGRLKGITVPAADVAGLRSRWDATTLRDGAILKLSLLSYPNVVVELRRPVVHKRRTIRAIAHRLDHPAAFAAAIGTLVAHG